MITIRFEKGLEGRLSQTELQQFNTLMGEYATAVLQENARLVTLDPPYGIRDVKEYLDRVQNGENAAFPGNFFIAIDEKEVLDRTLDTPPRRIVKDIVGLLAFVEEGRFLCETHLVVSKRFSGKGIGTLLLQAFILHGKREGFEQALIYNFTVGGYATFRKVEQMLNDQALAFENLSRVVYSGVRV